MSSLVLRFSDQVSRFETTQQRLKDIAEYFGLSQNKAAAYAINALWEHLAQNEGLEEALAFKRQGKEVGGITYMNAEDVQRAQARVSQGVELPHENDSELENNLLFQFLSAKQQAAIHAASDPAEKRRLKAAFLRECIPENAADNFSHTTPQPELS
jgi:hypothetical protein